MEHRYTSFSSIALAGEESFIGWVLHKHHEDQWVRWIEQHAEMHGTIDEARGIVLSISAIPTDHLTVAGKKELWNRIHTSTQSATKQPVNNKRRLLWTWGITAAAAIAFLFWINSLTTTNKIHAQAGEQKVIVLPEESNVTLNAGSTISYRDKSFEKDRILRLEGEAFFKVKPGSTFTVETDYGTVTVLGTSFNVLSRNGRFEVHCYSGKVKVENSKKEQLVITAGEKSNQNKGENTLHRSTFTPTSAAPAWTVGRFSFENQPLSEVIEELERQYAITVSLEAGLGDLKYTGVFETGDLEKALYLITWPLHLKSSTKGKEVTISR